VKVKWKQYTVRQLCDGPFDAEWRHDKTNSNDAPFLNAFTNDAIIIMHHGVAVQVEVAARSTFLIRAFVSPSSSSSSHTPPTKSTLTYVLDHPAAGQPKP
jgi:hypothetical protein